MYSIRRISSPIAKSSSLLRPAQSIGSLATPLAAAARRRSKRRGILAAAASIILSLSMVSAAGATSLSMWPTFECYHYNNGRASITLDKLQVNDDGLNTAWGAVIYRWNGRQWVVYRRTVSQVFQDSSFGKLEQQPISIWVTPNRYYRAVILVRSTGDRTTQLTYARAIAGYYRPTICHT